jgi:integration host factor subunit beta
MGEGTKLTKTAIVETISQRTTISKKDIQMTIDIFFGEIKDSLIQNNDVELRGFGTFKVRIRKGRENARNPKTGETVAVESHGVAVFRPGKELKKAVWSIRK